MLVIQPNSIDNPREFADDTDLATSAAAGNVQSQRVLISRLLPRVRRTVSYLVGDPECAADVAQLALIRILKTVHSYRGESTLEYWASRIATRTALNHQQKKARRKALQTQSPPREEHFLDADDAAALVWARQMLHKMLANLPEKQRVVVVLRHIEGFKVDEIASIIGVGHNTVRQRLRAGNANLRREVKRHPDLKSFVLGRVA